jgi:hypothetical protein
MQAMDDKKSNNANGDFGFAFVGSYLNQCARVEAWTITMLAAHGVGEGKAKVPHLFGQKLKAVRELTDSRPEIFNKPERVVVLMQKFEEPAKLRSSLAHSVMHRASNSLGNFYLFHNGGTDDRFWFCEGDMKTSLSELKKLVKEILDQKPKTTPPPSPPQPKQGAATGP